jgi:hypothetical protein
MPKPGVLTCLILVAAAGVARAEGRQMLDDLHRLSLAAAAAAPAGSQAARESQFNRGQLTMGVAGLLTLAKRFSPEMLEAAERTLRLGTSATGESLLRVGPMGEVTLATFGDGPRQGDPGASYLTFRMDDRVTQLEAQGAVRDPADGPLALVRRMVVFRGPPARASAFARTLQRYGDFLHVTRNHLTQRRDGQLIHSRYQDRRLLLDRGGFHKGSWRSPAIRWTTPSAASGPKTTAATWSP